MVCRRVALILGLLATTATAADTPIERRPYRIRAWVVVDPSCRLDGPARSELIRRWKGLVDRHVGAPWSLEVAEGEGPLATASGLDDLKAEAVATACAGLDRGWVIALREGESGCLLEGRALDIASGTLGPVVPRAAPFRGDLPRALLGLGLDLFEPSAEVGEESAGVVTLRVQGAALPGGGAPIVGPGRVFRAFRVFEKPDGSTIRLDAIRSTYIKVNSVENGIARGRVVSAYANPLTRKVVQRNRLIALGVRPSAAESRLRFLGPPPEKAPAAGYSLTARAAPEAAPREVGTTDREGHVTLKPGFADGLTILRLMAADVEPLAEFPFMPGEAAQERTIVLASLMGDAVAFQTRLVALRDEIVDLVARRSRLESLLKSRAEGEAWDDVKTLLDDHGKLATRASVDARLQKLEADARARQTPKNAVLTRSAQVLLADTKGLVDRYLDDEAVKIYDEAYRASKSPGVGKVALPSKAAADDPVIQGLWRLEGGGNQTIQFRRDAATITPATGDPLRGTFRLDATHLPKGIDLTLEGQPFPLLGIYELTARELRLCLAPAGQARPSRFAAPVDSGLKLYLYRKGAAAAENAAPPAEAPKARPAPPPAGSPF